MVILLRLTLLLLALMTANGCAPIDRVASLGSADKSLFLYIDGYIYECRGAGEGAKALDTRASQEGARSVCTRAFIVNRE